MRPADQQCQIEHATAVALEGRAVVMTGPSGSGKSAFALQLMALGAGLVADDRCCLWRIGNQLMVDAPAAIRGRIEARYLGILNADFTGPTQVSAYIRMDRVEDQRLPPFRQTTVLGLSVPVLHNVQSPYFAAAVLQYLQSGRWA